jgi:DNA-directed RNA polymerase subunit RPC12/RpoP
MVITQQKQEYIKKIIGTSKNRAHREFEIICGRCGKIMIRYIIYYYAEYVDVNLHSLIDYRCPNCNREYKEIEL